MLSDDALDELVQPIIDRQEEFDLYVLQMIAARIKSIGKMLPSDIQQLIRLRVWGADVQKINNELARITELQVDDIKHIIRTIAEDVYTDAKPLYDYQKEPYIPFKENEPLQKVIKAIERQTEGTFRNLSNSKAIGYITSTNTGSKRFQNIDKAYKSVIDRAIQANQSGLDYGTAIRKTLNELLDSGLRRLYWESGYTQRLDTAVRRNILDGIREINQETHNITGEQFHANGKELTAHVNCALDHEPFQGHQFTNEEWENLQSSKDFKDVDGQTFLGVRRIIGQWNCRHFAYSIVIGFSQPNYTKEQLQKMIDDNHKGYTLPNGKHLTMYECTQVQRQLETRIRYAKEKEMTMKAAGDKEEAEKAHNEVRKLIQEYSNFSASCKLKPRFDKTYIPGYK